MTVFIIMHYCSHYGNVRITERATEGRLTTCKINYRAQLIKVPHWLGLNVGFQLSNVDCKEVNLRFNAGVQVPLAVTSFQLSLKNRMSSKAAQADAQLAPEPQGGIALPPPSPGKQFPSSTSPSAPKSIQKRPPPNSTSPSPSLCPAGLPSRSRSKTHGAVPTAVRNATGSRVRSRSFSRPHRMRMSITWKSSCCR